MQDVKDWVVLRWAKDNFMTGNKKGDITLYPDYVEEYIGDSPMYEVVDYFTGTYHNAKRFANTFREKPNG
jgi:hypothetical protein